jgi:DNA-binding response OmpR family regulator
MYSPHADESAFLTLMLQQAGLNVRAVRSLRQLVENLPERQVELVLLTEPAEYESLERSVKHVRAASPAMLILITEPLAESETVRLLEFGADLVISRPYGVRLLLAQIRALMRRGAAVPFYSLPTLTHRDIVLDPTPRTVQVNDGEPIRLTQLEFRLLYMLMTHPSEVIPTEQIVENVWGYAGEGNRELVRGLVQRLRSKIEPEPKNPRYIQTQPGIGYYFNLVEE